MIIPTEAQEQQKLVKWLRLKKIFHFAPINENQGSFTNRKVAMIQEAKAKSMGKIKGTSDLVVMLPNKILFIELKRAKRKLKSGKYSTSHTKTSPEQLEFLQTVVDDFDYADAFVCYGFEEAREFIEKNLTN